MPLSHPVTLNDPPRHLKLFQDLLFTNYRMQDNFLSGRESASINAMLAATEWNLKRMMKDLAKKSAKTLFVLLQILFGDPQYKLQTAQ